MNDENIAPGMYQLSITMTATEARYMLQAVRNAKADAQRVIDEGAQSMARRGTHGAAERMHIAMLSAIERELRTLLNS